MMTTARRAVEINAESAENQAIWCMVLDWNNRPAEAVQAGLKATKLDPNNSDAFQNLGICYRETDQKDRALKAFETADRIRKQSR